MSVGGQLDDDATRLASTRERELVVAGLLVTGLAALFADGAWRWLAVGPLLLLATVAILAVRHQRRDLIHLREEREQLQRLLDIPAQVHFLSDSAGRYTHISQRWTEWTGLSLRESANGGWGHLVHPDDAPAILSARAEALTAGVPLDHEFRLRHRSGDYRWKRLRAFPHHPYPGAPPTGWSGTLEDIHDQRTAEAQQRQSATLLEMIGSSTDSLMWAKDRDGRMLYANRAFERETGVRVADIIGLTDPEWNPNPKEAEAFAAADALVMNSGDGQLLEEVFTGSNGKTRYYRSLKSPLRDQSGKVIGVVGTSTDITEQREAEQREKLLTAELDHRAKNLLAVVQSVVALTRADTLPAFKEAVSGRIQALGRAHSMIAASRWEGADLQRVLTEELAPYRDNGHGQVDLAGPPLLLKPAAAQSLALVVHELATNAAKYGALSVPDGTLSVHWQLTSGDRGRPLLALRWVERGGPPVAPRDERGRVGFGSRLIQSSVERQLGGSLAIDWAPEGLQVAMEIALDRSLQDLGGGKSDDGANAGAAA